MFKLFYSPIEAVDEAMDTSLGVAILFLLGVSILAGVSALLLMIGTTAKAMLLIGLATLVTVFVGTLISSLLVTWTLNMIKTDGVEYRLGLIALTAGLVVPSVAVLIGILVSYIPYVGEIIAMILIFIGCLMGISESLRALTSYFEADFITVFTALLALNMAVGIAVNFGVVRKLIDLMIMMVL